MPNSSTNSLIASSVAPGLSNQEAQLRLKQFGLNAVKEYKSHPIKHIPAAPR